MPAYNYEHYVGRAIESALTQDYPADRMEIIVVDDGSTDATAAVVAALAEQHPGPHPPHPPDQRRRHRGREHCAGRGHRRAHLHAGRR